MEDIKKLYIPSRDSHKGQNGKLLIVGGSHLFHGASLWALKVASRIVDMVFYASTTENNELTQKLKSEFYDFIAIPREKIGEYAKEADCILIGPGLPRKEGEEEGDNDTKEVTERLLAEYPGKKWVIDGGSLQTMDPKFLKILNGNVIITPHPKELQLLEFKIQNSKFKITHSTSSGQAAQNAKLEEQVEVFAQKYNCVVLLKGMEDLICSPTECVQVSGGNAGMTKGGTGDVLAGLVAALYCKNDAFLAAKAASFINKKSGDSLDRKVGPYFNASDLCDEIPTVMKELLA